MQTTMLPPPERCDNCASQTVSLIVDRQGRQRWECLDCGAMVYCHTGTEKPYGRMADRHTRELRKQLHAEFDRLYSVGIIAKAPLYRLLNERYFTSQDEFHISWLPKDMLVDLLERCRNGWIEDEIKAYKKREAKNRVKRLKRNKRMVAKMERRKNG